MAKKKAPATEEEPKPKKRARQPSLDGMEAPRDEELSNLILTHVDLKDRRMALTKEESAAKKRVLEYMREHGVKTYFDSETGAESWIEEGEIDVKDRIRPTGGGSPNEDKAIGANTLDSPGDRP